MIKGSQRQDSTDSNSSTSRSDVKAINTTMMLLSQKIGYIVRNEKVLSKNILVLNDKLKKLDDKIVSVKDKSEGTGVNSDDLDPLKSQIEELYNKVKGLHNELDSLRDSIDSLRGGFASRSELKEIKYLVDAINPLEFITYKQLKEYIKK